MPASRSLIALLIGTVVFFALWMVALKPSSKSGNGSPSQGLGQYQSAINKAHQAVATSNASNAASGNVNTSSSGAGASSSKSSTSTSKPAVTPATHTAKATAKPATKHTAKAASKSVTMPSTPKPVSLASEMSTVKTAVTDHKVVALLFYNPAAADDRALKQELGSVGTHKGQVVKLAVPLNQSGSFTALTQQVPVNLSPTLVVISRAGDASEDVGYTAPFVIDQQVSDALAAK